MFDTWPYKGHNLYLNKLILTGNPGHFQSYNLTALSPMADIDALVSRIKNELRTEIKDEFVGELRQLQNKNEQLEAELQTLRDKNAVEDEWLEAADSRNAGTIDLPENLRHLFHQDSIHHRKEIRTVYKVLSDYPEPRGGWLRPQEMDSYTVSDEYKNNEDKALMMRNASYSKVSNHQSWSTSYSTILQEPNCRSSKTSEHLISSQLSSTYTLHKKSESLEECKLLENSTSSPNPKPMKEWEAAMTHSSSGPSSRKSSQTRSQWQLFKKMRMPKEKSHQVAFSEANQIQVGEEEETLHPDTLPRDSNSPVSPPNPTININISVGLSPIDSNSTAWMERNDEQPIHPRDSRQGIQIRTHQNSWTNQGILKIPPISERVTKSSKRLFNKRYSRGIERSTRVLSVFHDKTNEKFRPILDLRSLNKFLSYKHFKMEGNQRSNFVNHQGLFLYKNRFKGRLPFNTNKEARPAISGLQSPREDLSLYEIAIWLSIGSEDIYKNYSRSIRPTENPRNNLCSISRRHLDSCQVKRKNQKEQLQQYKSS